MPSGYSAANIADGKVLLGDDAAKTIGEGLEIAMVPCLSDNYCAVLTCKKTGVVAVVDTPEAGPIIKYLEEKKLKLTHILNTHKHWDHVGGNEELCDAYENVSVYGPNKEMHDGVSWPVGHSATGKVGPQAIPRITNPLNHNDKFKFGECAVEVLDVPGHTVGHIAYHFPEQRVVFSGDALFVLGCGRMFEGNPPMFWKSMKEFKNLPDNTLVYCAHEYTEANYRFALSVDPDNKYLQKMGQRITELRGQGLMTVPSIMGQEKAANPFLRADEKYMADKYGGGEQHEVFACLRKAKDNF